MYRPDRFALAARRNTLQELSMKLPKDLVAASAKPLILSILSRGENYGYAIIQEVRRLSAGHMQWTDGMLYPVLHRLQRQGLMESRWKISEAGRKRKYYRLRQSGKVALNKERQRWLVVHAALKQLWEVPHVQPE
jgi:DNA-binding PadR family transcriptional regulator